MRLIASGWFSSEVSSKNFSITLKSAVLIVNLRILSELHEQCQVGLEKNIGKTFIYFKHSAYGEISRFTIG